MTTMAIRDEITYLRGHNWNAKRIADEITVPVDVVLAHHRDYKPSERRLLAASRAGRRESLLVYSRSCPEIHRDAPWLKLLAEATAAVARAGIEPP